MSKSPITTIKPIEGLSLKDMRRAPTHPGEIFRLEFREPSGVSQAEAARRLQLPTNRLNEFERGKRGVTADSAIRLAALTGTSPEFWLTLQANVELWHAYQKLKKSGTLKRVETAAAISTGA